MLVLLISNSRWVEVCARDDDGWVAKQIIGNRRTIKFYVDAQKLVDIIGHGDYVHLATNVNTLEMDNPALNPFQSELDQFKNALVQTKGEMFQIEDLKYKVPEVLETWRTSDIGKIKFTGVIIYNP